MVFFIDNKKSSQCVLFGVSVLGKKEMNIHKVINNNVLSAYNEQNQEIVIMGRGIGFKARPGDVIDESKIEKIFCIENRTLSKQFQDMVSSIPLEHMQISTDIIAYAKNECNMKLNQSIYVALTDHINFAIERYRQGIQLPNALLWEIRQFYHREYMVGEYALRLLAERLDVHFKEDEAGFIALHFVNAVYDISSSDTYSITNMLQGIMEIVKAEFRTELDESTMFYERFIAHLKFLARRIFKKELLQEHESELANLIEKKYPAEYACGTKIVAYIEREYGVRLTGEEEMYLAIHIRRILEKEKME